MAGIPERPAPIARPRTRFTVPQSARVFPGDPETVTLSPVTAREEIMANRAAVATGGGTDAALTFELCRRSVVAVNDKKVDWSETGGDGAVGPDWIDATSPQLRNLVSIAFLTVNRPSRGAEQDFLASAVTEVA